MRRKSIIVFILLVALVLAPGAVEAASIAIFGDNSIEDLVLSLGHTVDLVTDAEIATAGFLSGFDAFIMTRDGSSFGIGLSPAAAAAVALYVGSTGSIVLFNSDIADTLPGGPTPNAAMGDLFANAVSFAAASGHGFIGEFNGAVSALTGNSDGLTPIGLISGTAGMLSCCPADGPMSLTPAGVGHPIAAGITFPTADIADLEFGSVMTGIDPSLVIATFDSGNPAIIASAAAVPEPTTLLLLGGGLLGISGYRCWRRRKRFTA